MFIFLLLKTYKEKSIIYFMYITIAIRRNYEIIFKKIVELNAL